MIMKKEELMQPRYKVIANYPGQPVAIGQLLNDRLSESFHITTTYSFEGFELVPCANWVNEDEVKKYPALFKKLEWWEDRKPEDMPDFLKATEGGIIKVKKWQIDEDETNPHLYFTTQADKLGFYPRKHLPATLEEYTAYHSTQTP